MSRTSAGENPGALALAGAASLAAGAVHAAAVGAHADHRAAAAVFTAVAAAQLLWGALALVRPTRSVALAGTVLGMLVVAGWVLATRIGVPFVNGLGSAGQVQVADTAAAVLGATTVTAAATSLLARRPRLPVGAGVVTVCAVGLLGVAAVGGHQHPSAGLSHVAAAHVAPVPYDPALPIDLGGVPGVTPAQQARAERLVAVTVSRLPRWSDARLAERAGFRSIGDGFTGTEHLISQEFLNDDVVLDPDRPESLVYDTSSGGRRLVAAMYMLRPGTPLEQVPDVGGALVQWHTHEDLCFTRSGKVAGVVDARGACPSGLVQPEPAPMVHVWITPHRCGPFAALEGIAGGQIAKGQTRLCDSAHGARS